MGVGLPYAMGIKLAKPEADVFCITGEGSIQMCIQELSTCLQYNTPVKIVSLNNRYLGMVRQWQQLDYGGRYSHSYMDALPDFVKLAEAYGHVGLLIEKPSDVEPALARGDPAEGPHRVPRHPHRPDGERLADGAGGQGHHRNAAGLRRPVNGWQPRPSAVGRYRARRRGSRRRMPACGFGRSILQLATRGQRPAVTAAGRRRARQDEQHMKHIIAVLLENEPGALSRVVALFSARGYNIESLTVAPTEDASLSRMTIVTTGSRRSHRADHQAPEPADRGGQGRGPDRRQLTPSAS